MASNLKPETSRLNGAKCRGPVTAAGRGILLACESADEYQELCNHYQTAYAPEGRHETLLVAQMAEARWRILRYELAETGLFNAEMARQESKKGDVGAKKLLASAFLALATESEALDYVSRQQVVQHDIHDRAHNRLRKLQQDRLSTRAKNLTSKLPNEPTVDASKALTPDPPGSIETKWKN
jgi:hypothetical protein